MRRPGLAGAVIGGSRPGHNGSVSIWESPCSRKELADSYALIGRRDNARWLTKAVERRCGGDSWIPAVLRGAGSISPRRILSGRRYLVWCSTIPLLPLKLGSPRYVAVRE
jgi:hypothetical protein